MNYFLTGKNFFLQNISLYKGSFLDWYAQGEPVIQEGINLSEVIEGAKEDRITAIVVDGSLDLMNIPGALDIQRT